MHLQMVIAVVGLVTLAIAGAMTVVFLLQRRQARDGPGLKDDDPQAKEIEMANAMEMARAMDGVMSGAMSETPPFQMPLSAAGGKLPSMEEDRPQYLPAPMVAPKTSDSSSQDSHQRPSQMVTPSYSAMISQWSEMNKPATSPTDQAESESLGRVESEQPNSFVGGNGTSEEDVLEWLGAVSGETCAGQDFHECLKDGLTLCKVANAIQPGIIPKVNSKTLADMDFTPLKKMENITAFTEACRTLGVVERNLFSTVDLFEAEDLQAVRQCIAELGQRIRTTAPSFHGPYLGVERFVDHRKKSYGEIKEEKSRKSTTR